MADIGAGDRPHVDGDRVERAHGRLAVQQRRTGSDRLEGVEDRWQFLVRDLHRFRRGAGCCAGRRGDGGHDVADVAGDIGEHALVLDLAAVRSEVGHIIGSEHDHVVRKVLLDDDDRACGCGERTNAAWSMPGRSASTE